jgi:hypothetical protein
VRASGDTTQAPLPAIFLAREDIPSSSPPSSACVHQVQVIPLKPHSPPSSSSGRTSPAHRLCLRPQLKTPQTPRAAQPKSVNSSISPSVRAIEARAQVSSAVNTACGVSTPKRNTQAASQRTSPCRHVYCPSPTPRLRLIKQACGAINMPESG